MPNRSTDHPSLCRRAPRRRRIYGGGNEKRSPGVLTPITIESYFIEGRVEWTPMNNEDEAAEHQLRNEALISNHVKSLLRPAKRAYRQSLTSLWLGNGGASLAVLSFIAATWKDGAFLHQLLWPLTCFVVGLISMGVGTGLYLLTIRRVGRLSERATRPQDLRGEAIKSPTEKAGLTFNDWRTRMAILSTGFFVLGCAIGLVELWASH